MANLQNPVKAIRLKCLDCCCGSSNEVKLCPVEKCPIYPFRDGKNPFREKKELSTAQIEQRRQALALANSKRGVTATKSANSPLEGKDTTQ